MAEFFVRQVCAREGREGLSFSPEAMALLGRYRWPGNVRELQNVCERAVVLSAAGAGAIERSLIESWLSVGDVAAASVMTEAKPSSGATSGLGANGHAGGLSNGHANGAGGTNGSSYGTVSAPMDTEYVQAAGRTLEEIERDVIVRTLGRFNGHRQKTARSLGIGVRTLGLKLKKWKDMRIVPATL